MRGEKIGWIGGWLGGFAWAALLAVVWLLQGNLLIGLLGLGLTIAAVVAVLATAPWRHPSTPQWKLMLPLYGLLLACLPWAVWGFGGVEASGLRWWQLSWILPLFTPLFTVGRRRWADLIRRAG